MVGSGEWKQKLAEKWCLAVFFGWVVMGSDGQWWVVVDSCE